MYVFVFCKKSKFLLHSSFILYKKITTCIIFTSFASLYYYKATQKRYFELS